MDHLAVNPYLPCHHQALRTVTALSKTTFDKEEVNPLFSHGFILMPIGITYKK
jgi:hypothetical protein